MIDDSKRKTGLLRWAGLAAAQHRDQTETVRIMNRDDASQPVGANQDATAAFSSQAGDAEDKRECSNRCSAA